MHGILISVVPSVLPSVVPLLLCITINICFSVISEASKEEINLMSVGEAGGRSAGGGKESWIPGGRGHTELVAADQSQRWAWNCTFLLTLFWSQCCLHASVFVGIIKGMRRLLCLDLTAVLGSRPVKFCEYVFNIVLFSSSSKHYILIVILMASYMSKFVTSVRIQSDWTSATTNLFAQTNMKSQSVVVLNTKHTRA